MHRIINSWGQNWDKFHIMDKGMHLKKSLATKFDRNQAKDCSYRRFYIEWHLTYWHDINHAYTESTVRVMDNNSAMLIIVIFSTSTDSFHAYEKRHHSFYAMQLSISPLRENASKIYWSIIAKASCKNSHKCQFSLYFGYKRNIWTYQTCKRIMWFLIKIVQYNRRSSLAEH